MACLVLLTMLVAPVPGQAAPYAAIVVDARNGEVLHSRSADRRLHPASLTKMMTLYVVFEAIKNGEISLDQTVRVSRNASREPPSKIGLRPGQRISIRYLIRAAAIKSANDAATALGEAVSGSERAFAQRMTATARALGMNNTTFRNAHGLTQSGHLSTARDMARLSRHLFYDHAEYYNLFGRTQVNAGVANIRNTNWRLLQNYRGADGIKTGYTRAAGYNLASSAERGQERIIAVIFGGRSSSARYKRMVELLDMGFARAESRVAVVRPQRPGARESGAVLSSFRPMPRGASEVTQLASALNLVGSAFVSPAQASVSPAESFDVATPGADGIVRPRARPLPPGQWGVQLGAYKRRDYAEQVLKRVVISQIEPLTTAYRKVEPATVGGVRLYEAQFVGLTEADASSACARLRQQNRICRLVAPSG
ncbi:MAG: D-alanyl-D-alanine carboxypeptidase family protein [Pseudomonadota bacterium]